MRSRVKEIHITDMQTFLQCRRRWNWSSQMRMGLQRAFMPAPLFLGQGAHRGLDAYYKSDCDVDAALEHVGKWVEEQKRKLHEFSDVYYNLEIESIDESHQLIRAMIAHYALWAPTIDAAYEMVSTEQKYSVPIFYESKRVVSPLRLAGRIDGVVRSKANGKLYLLEFKTTRSLYSIDWVFNSIQGTAYTWAATKLFGEPIGGVLYRMLRKKAPANPRVLKNGTFSNAKSQDTSFAWMKYALEQVALQKGTDPRILWTQCRELLLHLRSEPNKFFTERMVTKTGPVLADLLRALRSVGRMMADPDVPIFTSPPWNYCNTCPFRDPCDLQDAGGDYKGVLEAEYAPRTYWEEVPE